MTQSTGCSGAAHFYAPPLEGARFSGLTIKRRKALRSTNMSDRTIYDYIARDRAFSIGFGKSIVRKKSEGYR